SASRGQASTIRTERHTVDRTGMALEGEEFLAGSHPPQFQCLVDAAGGEALAIGAEGHAADRAGMALERAEFLAAGHVPELYRLVPASGGQALVIGTKGHAPDDVGMSPKRRYLGKSEMPQVMPFKSAQVLVSGLATGRLLQQLKHVVDPAPFPGLLCQ